VETHEVFFCNIQKFKEEDALLLLQRHFRARYFFPIPDRWESNAFQFSKPAEVAKAERERQGWAVLRRRSKSERKLTDVKGLEWEQFADTVTGEIYFHCEKTGDSQWVGPKVPDMAMAQARRNAQATLKVGDKVYYRFASGGGKVETMCFVTNVRQNDEDYSFLYDIAKLVSTTKKRGVPSKNRSEIEKWVTRGLLRQVPKSAEEIKEEQQEENWVMQLRRARDRDERGAQRQKQWEAEQARLKRRGGRKKAERKSMSADEVAAARARRVSAEKAIRDDEERKKKEELQNKAVLAAAAKAGAR